MGCFFTKTEGNNWTKYLTEFGVLHVTVNYTHKTQYVFIQKPTRNVSYLDKSIFSLSTIT